jgi:hypothetical protein
MQNNQYYVPRIPYYVPRHDFEQTQGRVEEKELC